jgi:toxin HigB-1
VNILFDDSKFEKECNERKLCIKRHGQKRADKIEQRLADLRAAATLEIMRNLPGKCHELTSNLSGHFAVDLDQPYRLLFVPAHDPVMRNSGGGIDWTKVTSIRIIRVENYHGK